MHLIRRVLTALGFPLPLYDDLRELEERARERRAEIRRDRVSRDFAETLAVPPFWRERSRPS